jgi:uncharacterized membrane protein
VAPVLHGTAGATVSTTMSVENDGDEPVRGLAFVATDLLHSGGERLAGDRVRSDPAAVTIEPGGSERVTIVVDVPDEAAPGTYTGLLQATTMEHVRIVLTVRVEDA